MKVVHAVTEHKAVDVLSSRHVFQSLGQAIHQLTEVGGFLVR